MTQETQQDKEKQWSIYSLALNLGYMIITPILIFGVGGVFLDKYLGTFPLFVFIGFFLAISSGIGIVYYKMKDLIQPIPKPKAKSDKNNNSNSKE
ncbi:MAG: AtpZ/AtpI family protein [Patescibacteria group bacterium]